MWVLRGHKHSVHRIHAGWEAEIPSSSLRGLTLRLLGSSRHGPRDPVFCGLGESSIAQHPAVPLLVWGWKRQGREIDWRTFATSSFFFPFYDLCGPQSCFSVSQTQRTTRILGPLCGPLEPHTCPHPSKGTATPALWFLRKKILTRSYLSYEFKISFRRLQNLVSSWTHLTFSICHSVSRRLSNITYNPPWLKQRHQVNTEHLFFFLPTFSHMKLPPLHTHTHTHKERVVIIHKPWTWSLFQLLFSIPKKLLRGHWEILSYRLNGKPQVKSNSSSTV